MIKYKKYIYTLLSVVCIVVGVSYYVTQQHDLPQITHREKIRVVATDTAQSFEYELLQLYAQNINAKIEIVQETDFEAAAQKLDERKAEMLLRLLPTTTDLQQKMLLTRSITKTQLLLVQNKNSATIKNCHELENETIFVEKHSPYLTRLQNIQEEIGLENLVVEEVEATPKELLNQLIDSKIKLTVYDSFSLHLLPKNPALDTRKISTHHFLAWGVAESCPALHSDLNRWLETFVNSLEYRELLRKYYH